MEDLSGIINNLMTFGINFEIHLIMILQKNMEDLINEKYKKNFL